MVRSPKAQLDKVRLITPGTTLTLKDVDLPTLTVESKLGEGGFGVVFAVVTQGGRRFAAKVMDASARTGFALEVLAVARMRERIYNDGHQDGRVLPVFAPALHGFGLTSDEQFVVLVMELAPGTLCDLRPPASEVHRIAWAMATALHSLNQVGMVHGDVKPSNILMIPSTALDGSSWPLVTDFGATGDLDRWVVDDKPLGPDDKRPCDVFTKSFVDPQLQLWTMQMTLRNDMWSWAQTVRALASDTELPEVLASLLAECQNGYVKRRPASFAEIAERLQTEELAAELLQWAGALRQRQDAEQRQALEHKVVLTQALQVILWQLEEAEGGRPTETESRKRKAAKVREFLGSAFIKMGLYAEAEVALTPAVKYWGASLEPNCRAAFLCTESLAESFLWRDRFDEAEALCRRLVRMTDDQPHSDLRACAYNDLGLVLTDKGDHGESLKYARLALESYEVVLGPDHRDTLIAVGNVALTLQHLGRLDEAEHYSLRSFEGTKAAVGDAHELTLSCLHYHGDLLVAGGRLDEARPFVEQAFQGRKAVLGEGHPQTKETGVLYQSLQDKIRQRGAASPAAASRAGGQQD